MFCGMFTPTLLVLWLFNFNIYFCGGYSAHNGYPGHCFRLSPSHRNPLRGGGSAPRWCKWVGECRKALGRGQIIHIYPSQKHLDRNKGKRIKFWEEEETKILGVRLRKKVEKTKLEGTVLFARGGNLWQKVSKIRSFLKPPTFKTFDSCHFSS